MAGVASEDTLYICSGCNTPTKREHLTVKKAVFLTMGAGGQTIRSRVRHWLCPACLIEDGDYQAPPFSQAAVRRVRAAAS